jgi:hypothetical protein
VNPLSDLPENLLTENSSAGDIPTLEYANGEASAPNSASSSPGLGGRSSNTIGSNAARKVLKPRDAFEKNISQDLLLINNM